MTKRPALPMALPGGEMLPFMSARRRHEICDVVFEMAGGVDRLAHVVSKSDEHFMEFITKVWVKGLPKVASTEHHVEGVEELLDKLDSGEHAKVINGAAEILDPE